MAMVAPARRLQRHRSTARPPSLRHQRRGEPDLQRVIAQANGTLATLMPFAERGGESVAVDAKGNYDGSGKPIGQIDVPERPTCIVFGGPDRRTLFILMHRTLYAVKTRISGS